MMRILLLLGSFCFISFQVAAQDAKTEIFSGGSFAFFKDSQGLEPHYSVGSFDFGIGQRISKGFGIEFSGRRIHANNHKVSYPYESTLWVLGGNVLYNFSDLKVQPFIFGGGALLDYHRETGAPSLPEKFISDENSFGIHFGVGVHAFLTRNLALRPQFSVLYDTELDEHSEQHGYLISFSAALSLNF